MLRAGEWDGVAVGTELRRLRGSEPRAREALPYRRRRDADIQGRADRALARSPIDHKAPASRTEHPRNLAEEHVGRLELVHEKGQEHAVAGAPGERKPRFLG